MSYLQFMIKCLSFFKNEKEPFDSYDFYYHWLLKDDSSVDLDYKSKAKKAIMYLLLKEVKNSVRVNDYLLEALEKDLSYYDVSITKTLDSAEKKAFDSISEDFFMFDRICLLEQDLLSEDEQKEMASKLFHEFKSNIPDELETVVYESAIHTVMEIVSRIIPELYFTERGYKHIDKKYAINNPELRKKCYDYIRKNIKYYNSERIYKIDESLYYELFEDEEYEEDFDEEDFEEDEEYEEDFDEEDFEEDEEYEDYDSNRDEIRDEIDIYGEDIDNYDMLFYSVTLLTIMLRFIKNKEYNKLERLIELDDVMTNSYKGTVLYEDRNRFRSCQRVYYDKTLIESLYQPKIIEEDLNQKIVLSQECDEYLNFFLSKNEFTQQYSTSQLSLIAAHCFDFVDSDPINKLIKNNDVINNILLSGNIEDTDEKIKRLVKIKNSD